MAWNGYYLLIINGSQPQAVIDDCISALSISGKTLTSDVPKEKTAIRISIDHLCYIIECDTDSDKPTLSIVKNDFMSTSSRTGTEIDNLLKSITVWDNASACRTYIKDNVINWNVEE